MNHILEVARKNESSVVQEVVEQAALFIFVNHLKFRFLKTLFSLLHMFDLSVLFISANLFILLCMVAGSHSFRSYLDPCAKVGHEQPFRK